MGKSSRHTHRPQSRYGEARRQGALQGHLTALWHKLTTPKKPPACDRFLARELSHLDGLPRQDRLWLGDLLTDALRFGALTVFCEQWRRDGWSPDTAVTDRLAATKPPLGPELWHRLCRLPTPIVFYWTFMRKRLTGATLPPIAPPGPQANEVWGTMRDQCPSHPDISVRALWAGLPPGMTPLIAARAQLSRWRPEQTFHFLDQHAVRPPLWLRILRPEQTANLRRELTAAEFTVELEGAAAARVKGPQGVYELDAYRTGLCDIQDYASQCIGDAVDARPGQQVWDCCAGAGGKSLQLAAAMGPQGLVHATDIHASKLADLTQRAKRTGLANIQSQKWDGLTVPDVGGVVREQGGFDRVLVDAPCSGSGTWRRNVDGRFRHTTTSASNMTATQLELLTLAARGVRPGGKLIYATCSWWPAENENVCADFLAQHPQWRQLAHAICGNPNADSDTTYWAVFTRPTDGTGS